MGFCGRDKPLQSGTHRDWEWVGFAGPNLWGLLDISDKAIEEAAAIIVSAYQSGKKPS